MRRLFTGVALMVAAVSVLNLPLLAEAASLKDLLQRRPQLYLPSLLVSGKDAVFTVKARPGDSVHVILSSQNQGGGQLNNGQALRVGQPTWDAEAIVPESGVVQLTVRVPEDLDQRTDLQFVEAVVTSSSGQAQQVADVIDSSGFPNSRNAVGVSAPSDTGQTLILPGDMNMSGIMRGITSLQDIGNDPRKRQLIDEGTINRGRLLDQNLNALPTIGR